MEACPTRRRRGPRPAAGAVLHRRRRASALRPRRRRPAHRPAVAEPADPPPRTATRRPPAGPHPAGHPAHRGRGGLPAAGPRRCCARPPRPRPLPGPPPQPSRITIGYTTSIIVTPAVRELRRQHPDADVHTLHLDWNEPREALLDHRVDAVVARLPFPTGQLHVTILYDEPRLLLVPAGPPPGRQGIGHPRRHRRRAHPPAARPGLERLLAHRPPARRKPGTRRPPRRGHRGQARAHRRRPGRGHHPGRADRQPPPRPHHRPPVRRRAEPRRAGHPRRRPQPPGRGLPQVRPGPPHRPRVELFASVKFRRLTDPRNLPISGSVQAPPHHSRPQVHQKSGQRVT